MAFASSSHTEELDEPPGLPDKLKESFSGPILLKLGQRMNPEDAKYLKTEFGVTVHSRPIRKSRKTNVPDDLKDTVHELTLHGPPEKLDDAYQEAKRRLEENMENLEKESEEEKAAREAVKNQRLADHRKERERIKEERIAEHHARQAKEHEDALARREAKMQLAQKYKQQRMSYWPEPSRKPVVVPPPAAVPPLGMQPQQFFAQWPMQQGQSSWPPPPAGLPVTMPEHVSEVAKAQMWADQHWDWYPQSNPKPQGDSQAWDQSQAWAAQDAKAWTAQDAQAQTGQDEQDAQAHAQAWAGQDAQQAWAGQDAQAWAGQDVQAWNALDEPEPCYLPAPIPAVHSEALTKVINSIESILRELCD